MLPASRVRFLGPLGLLVVVPFVFPVVSAQQPAAQRMHEHLKALESVEYAVIRGDVDDAKQASRALADQLSMEGLPPDTQKHLSDLKAAAMAGAKAAGLPEVAKATADMTAGCGTCHVALKKPVKLGTPKPKAGAPSVRTRMREHIWSVQQMAYGLQAPDGDLWGEGAKAMKDARLITVQLKDEQLAKEINEAEAKFRELADKAGDTKDTAGRAVVYRDILTTCGTCHSLQGRVFGPGMPK